VSSTTERTNASTRLYVVVLGTLIGLTGVAHGIFEVFQGDRPTDGWVLSGIGAVTLIGNYRHTGIAAITVGLGVVTWTLLGVHRRYGPVVFLALSLLLVLVGGGVGILPVTIVASVVATRIRAPLSWWRDVLPGKRRRVLAAVWLPAFVSGFGLLVAGIIFWLLVLPPGPMRSVGTSHYLLWSVLVAGLACMMLAIVCGFARDIEAAA
jgi:hypothetical protein